MRKILIVDDSPADTRELTEILVQHGYEVIHAGDGESGLQAARDEQPHLVLMDIVMPGLNGFQALRVSTR